MNYYVAVIGSSDAGHGMRRMDSLEKNPDAGKG